MTDSLLATFGLYGGTFVIACLAGFFPIVSIEVFLIWATAHFSPTVPELALCVGLAAIGNQIAKTITYFAGAGALERGKLGEKVAAARHKIERWTRRPKLVLLASAVIGLPPLYLLGFIARPLLGIRFGPYTTICLGGRTARFIVVVLVPRLLA